MRLDIFIAGKEGCTRARAANIIKMGGVTVNGHVVTKAGAEAHPSDEIVVRDLVKFASLGGVKLENAISHFAIDVSGLDCLDLGAANGGFTHCLLSHGARSVAAVDLTLAFPKELREDPRVTLYDGVNVKDLPSLFEKERFDIVTADLSFISLSSLYPVFYEMLRPSGRLVTLFKPQYEVGRRELPKSGVVRDAKVIEKAFKASVKSAESIGFSFLGDVLVPEFFSDKNKERTVLFAK